MDAGEKIRAHVVSVWRERDRRFSVGGREGMLLLTDRHLMFVHKTESKMRWWQAVVQRQVVSLTRSRDPMLRHDGYGEAELARDMRNEKNVEVDFRDVLRAEWEDKEWGSTLRLEYRDGGRTEKRRFTVARDWVKYPAKDPTRFMRVDWQPFVDHILERRGEAAKRIAVYAVGVGPGAPEYMTRSAEQAIAACDIIVGYSGALDTADALIGEKDVREVTMSDQEAELQKILAEEAGSSVAVLFTGDASFSESEVVDRLAEVFGGVTIVPGVSAVQVAAARSRVPLDRCALITMHVTSDIEGKKAELVKAIIDGRSVILVPRPWPSRPDKQFMPSEVEAHLRAAGIDTSSLRVRVYEDLTLAGERVFEGSADALAGRKFSGHLVMVFDQHEADSYINYRWQWER